MSSQSPRFARSVSSMDRAYEIRLSHAGTGETRLIKGVVKAPEWDLMGLYLSEMRVLADAIGGFHTPIAFRLSIEQGKALSASSDALPDSEKAVLLHALRPFVLQDEPYSFHNTATALARSVNHEWIKRGVRWLRDKYSCKQLGARVEIEIGGSKLFSEQVLNNWLNGLEYHRDLEKRAALENWKANLPDGLAPGVLFGMLMEKVQAMVRLRELIRRPCEQTGESMALPLASREKGRKHIDAVSPEIVHLEVRALVSEDTIC